MGAIRLKTWQLSFHTSKKQRWRTSNDGFIMLYELKKFLDCVGRTSIQNVTVFIFDELLCIPGDLLQK